MIHDQSLIMIRKKHSFIHHLKLELVSIVYAMTYIEVDQVDENMVARTTEIGHDEIQLNVFDFCDECLAKCEHIAHRYVNLIEKYINHNQFNDKI